MTPGMREQFPPLATFLCVLFEKKNVTPSPLAILPGSKLDCPQVMQPFGLLCLAAFLCSSCVWSGGMKKPKLDHAVSHSGARADSLTEGQRTVIGRVAFKQSSTGWVTVEVRTQKGEFLSANWPYERPKGWQKINTNQVYRIDLLTQIYTKPDYVFNDLLRISTSDRVIVDTSVCHLHQVPMQRQLEDGDDAGRYPKSFFAVQKKHFPNDGNAYLACGSGISHLTWCCPSCHSLYQDWVKKHRLRY